MATPYEPTPTGQHKVKPFPIEGKVDGISDELIKQHRDILYAGYVNKLNEIETGLETVDRSKANGVYSAFRELKTEETFALNGTVLHELYFGNMAGKGSKPGPETMKLIERDFGSFAKWEDDFRACGLCARGWVIFGFNFYDFKIHNYVLDTHHFNVPVFTMPLLVLDVYEHAYNLDFGVKRAPYLDVFMKNIDWDVMEERLKWYSKLWK